MDIIDLTKKLYLIRNLIKDSQNNKSALIACLHHYPEKEAIHSFSLQLRRLLTTTPPVLVMDKNNKLTSRFALYLEAFQALCTGDMKPMISYLNGHKDVMTFLCKRWLVLEKLYYYSQAEDVILLDEYQLNFDKDYKIKDILTTKADKAQANKKQKHFTEQYKPDFFKRDDPNHKLPVRRQDKPENEKCTIELICHYFTMR